MDKWSQIQPVNTTNHTCWSDLRNQSICGPDIHGTTLSYPPWLVIFIWLLTAIFSIETILGNLLVLVAFKLERNIRRQLSNKFIVSLAVTDLIIGMEGFPLLTVYVVARERWPLGELLCEFWLFLDYTLCLVSILNVLLITVDRYGSVCYPAKYRTWQTRSRVRMFIIFSWIVPGVLFGMVILAWEPMTGHGMDDSGKCYAPFLDNPYVNMGMYLAYYWTTLVAMSILYRGIHTAAKALEDKSKARERQTIALLLGQRCMAQVGVGMLLHSSASEDEEMIDESFFHSPATVDAGYATDDGAHTELVRDSSTVSASVVNTVHSSGSTVTQSGYEQLRDDDPTTGVVLNSDSEEKIPANVPVIVTPISISMSSMRIPDTPTQEKTRILQRKLLYKEFGQGEDEDEDDPALSFVPLIDKSIRIDRKDSSASIFSPGGSKIFASKRSNSLRRVLAPMNSYGGVASIASKARRTKLINSLSLDEENIGTVVGACVNRKINIPDRKIPVDQHNSLGQNSACSLEYYGSNKSSNGSLYGDSSLNSIFDFGAYVSASDPLEPDENPLSSAPESMESSFITTNAKIQPNGDLAKSQRLIRASSTNSSFTSSVSSKTLTRSGSGSTSTRSTHDQFASVVPSTSVPTNLIQLNDEIPKFTNSRPSVQIKISPDTDMILAPIMEEEKSTSTTKTITRPCSTDSPRRESTISYTRNRPGTKKIKPDQKIVHLTVPGSSGSGSKGAQRRRTDANEANWDPRASWQSTTSSIYEPKSNKKSAGNRPSTRASQIDDDEDSCASGQANTDGHRASNATEDRKGSHWLLNLFNNPNSLLNRKRKVTKAERRARKAFRTITVIVGTFALFWSPYYIVATIYGFRPEWVPAPLFLTSYYLCYLNSSVNPFAYAFANRLFRKTFIRILKGDLRRT